MAIPEISTYLPPFVNNRPSVVNPVMQTPAPLVPPYTPKREVEYVDGEAGANSVLMGPNSSGLFLDKNENVLWVIATDQNGNKSLIKGYWIGDEYKPPKPVTLEDLKAQMQSMNERLNKMEEGAGNGQSNVRASGQGKPNGSGNTAGFRNGESNSNRKPDGNTGKPE